MRLLRTLQAGAAMAFFLAASSSFATELPASFPDDVPVAGYMQLAGVTEVGNSMMIDFHAPESITEAADSAAN